MQRHRRIGKEQGTFYFATNEISCRLLHRALYLFVMPQYMCSNEE